MIKLALRKTMVSNTKNIKLCDRRAQHRMYKCTLFTNLQLEGKAGSFNAM